MRVADDTAAPVAPGTTAATELTAENARRLLKALGDPIRLGIIEALGAGERCVCDLTGELGLAQSRLSFHLKVMKQAGLLADRQEGRWIYYRLRPEAIEALRSWLGAITARCSQPARPCR
jgi:ArsR family transcriptional regulator